MFTMKQPNSTFDTFEKLNAQIDVWIDEEKYEKISRHIKLSEIAKEAHSILFREGSSTCTNGKDGLWANLLNVTGETSPLIAVSWPDEQSCEPIADNYWAYLLWAKLVRAEIQKKGTDCYFRRLDQVATYLERHIPNPYNGEEEAILAVLYLLELSAASFSYESLGFAERARRFLHDNKYLKSQDHDNRNWYYELLCRYNIGVAYFHEARYQDAVLAFNYVIFEIESQRRTLKTKLTDKNGKKNRGKARLRLNFYDNLLGDALLYLPAIIYRADIQLKLQLAYHALKTLDRPACKAGLAKKENRYKRLKASLIKIQAYQLMDDCAKAKAILERMWIDLFGKGQPFPRQNPNGEMIDAVAFSEKIDPEADMQNLKGRLLTVSMDQHLDCLRKQKELLTKIDNEGKGRNQNDDKGLIAWLNDDKNFQYLKELGTRSFPSYFKAVEFERPDRDGCWEQLAEYLGWLAEVSQEKAIEDDHVALTRLQEIAHFCRMRVGMGHRHELITYLLERPPREREDSQRSQTSVDADSSCPFCAPKGIELARLEDSHYDDFRKRMVRVFEQQEVLGLQLKGKRSREEFVSRLIEVEQSRNDMRIRDLELRYESKTVTAKLYERSNGRRLKTSKGYCWSSIPEDKIRKQFDILPCMSSEESPDALGDLLPRKHYEQVMGQWDNRFLRHLECPSKHERQQAGLYFLGLQRWNSSSPAEGFSLGGGYLLYHLDGQHEVDFGIAIDPGFDFIRNLFHMGCSLNDIDIVLLSHAHIDHVRDFESIVMLLFELAKRKKQYRKVHVILTLAVYKRLEYLIENPKLRLHIEPYIIDIDREIETNYFEKLPEDKNHAFCFKLVNRSDDMNRFRAIVSKEPRYDVRVRPTRAYHDDHSGYSDSFGFLIDVRLPEQKEDVVIGYTGDTKWIYSEPEVEDPIKDFRDDNKRRDIKDIVDQYVSCHAVIVHLGSLITKDRRSRNYLFGNYNQCKRSDSKTPCEDLVRKEGHPYLIGLLRILTKLYKHNGDSNSKMPLILISEFGEELRGKIRVDLVKRLIGVYGERMKLLPVDVGITVRLTHEGKESQSIGPGREKKVLCVQCNRFVLVEEADFEHYGPDEAIYCVCKTCLKGTPFNVLQDRLRHLYEVGYELHSARESG